MAKKPKKDRGGSKKGKSTVRDFQTEYEALRSKYIADDAKTEFIEAVESLAAAARQSDQQAWALYLAGRALHEREQWQEAIARYSELVEQFADADDIALKVPVAYALVSKGFTLGEQKKPTEEYACYDQVLDRFGDAQELALKERMAGALLNKGVVLRKQNKPDEAIACYDQVLDRFGDAQELALKERVARALVNKGTVLRQQKKPDEAIACYDEVLGRFGQECAVNLRKIVAVALEFKAYCLNMVGRIADANEALELAGTYVDDPDHGKQVEALFVDGQKEADIRAFTAGFDDLLEEFPPDDIKLFQESMKERAKRGEDFLSDSSAFGDDRRSLFFDLREWNSFTPVIPDRHEIDRGGGYFIRYKGKGIVIDPGYDFIKNFGAVGGRVFDIDHIVLTHAHGDHTQDFEPLLSLLHEFNQKHKPARKQVYIYMSAGTARKFSGYLPLRGVGYVARVEVLNPGRKHDPQVVPLHKLDGATLTVLQAYHDDVVTLDYCVGLGFEFDFYDKTRRVVFTGDTGLFPVKKNDSNEILSDDKGRPRVDVQIDKALYQLYPAKFREADFMVVHIGSVKEYEFKRLDSILELNTEAKQFFYPNHLGLRGVATVLDKLRPKCVVISEWGEELKDIRFEIVRRLAAFLEKRKAAGEKDVYIVPGDLTVIYDIAEGSFFCHDDKKFHKIDDIGFEEVKEPELSRFYCKGVNRTYFFNKGTLSKGEHYLLNQVRHFHIDVDDFGLPQLLCGNP